MFCSFFQHPSGNGVRCEKCTKIEKIASGRKLFLHRLKGDLPGGGHAVRIISGLALPQNFFPVFLKPVYIVLKGDPGLLDVGPGLLQSQGQVAQLSGEIGCPFLSFLPVLFRRNSTDSPSFYPSERHLPSEFLLCRPRPMAGGNYHLAAARYGDVSLQIFRFLGIVEYQQPAEKCIRPPASA